ncbi:hypothetical protein GGTG_13250 [Gaeumannomyces tritici R3-111a-1]|uniref:Uncharacterized protein n=1 Tax=Gaeumannomyces tritici (strain R3-111a-1) TaxID=644352 RepID=J3PIC2_GAET3|nr:hypothetical protein GGTG_13250 [Gaeumannomyces tritici R3-111a-1]EJT69141.1 hypothetical protein GGTG_13250 [Gaeumannomyces tritici R3-111a-1]
MASGDGPVGPIWFTNDRWDSRYYGKIYVFSPDPVLEVLGHILMRMERARERLAWGLNPFLALESGVSKISIYPKFDVWYEWDHVDFEDVTVSIIPRDGDHPKKITNLQALRTLKGPMSVLEPILYAVKKDGEIGKAATSAILCHNRGQKIEPGEGCLQSENLIGWYRIPGQFNGTCANCLLNRRSSLCSYTVLRENEETVEEARLAFQNAIDAIAIAGAKLQTVQQAIMYGKDKEIQMQ